MKRINRYYWLFSLSLLLSFILPGKIQAASGNMGGGDGRYNTYITHGIDDNHVGWIYYLVNPKTNRQESATIAITCNEYGARYKVGSTYKDVETILLASRFGVPPDIIHKGKLKHPNTKDEDTMEEPSWGKPFISSNNSFIGLGDNVKAYLLSHEEKIIGGKKLKNKKPRAYGVILNGWNRELAERWENRELVLVFEPFYWQGDYNDKYINGVGATWRWTGKYVCATAYNLGNYQKRLEGERKISSEGAWALWDGTNGAYPHCVMLEGGTTDLGMSISEAQFARRNGRITNSTMANKVYGYGIGLVRSDKKPGINTYNGKDSPGNTEDPTKDKSKQGNKNIVKVYWDEYKHKNDITGYINSHTFKRERTSNRIRIMEEGKREKNKYVICVTLVIFKEMTKKHSETIDFKGFLFLI